MRCHNQRPTFVGAGVATDILASPASGRYAMPASPAPPMTAGPVLRAGFTDMLVTHFLTK